MTAAQKLNNEGKKEQEAIARIDRALRTIVRAGSARERRRVQLEIVD